LDGGVNDPANPATYTVETATINLADPTKAGHIFVRWEPTSSIPVGSTGNKTFTAIWEEEVSLKYYTVTFLWTDGTTVLAEVLVAEDGIINPTDVPQFGPDNMSMILSWLEKESGDPFDLVTRINKDYSLIPGEIKNYNYHVYLAPEKTSYKVGDTFLVDIMLVGNLNYTQIITEVAFDPALLQFEAYENLSGVMATCTQADSSTIYMRSLPSTNMITGSPCWPEKRIVTLKFTVLDDFAGSSVDTALSFISAQVNSPANYVGATTAPCKPITVTLNKE
jgi:hypothetical protein